MGLFDKFAYVNKKIHNIINLKEVLGIKKDNIKIKNRDIELRGRVVIIDDLSGEVVLDKNNLVLLRGRTFALEKMFGITNELGYGYNTANFIDKKICLFKVGNGGCVEGQPFNIDNTQIYPDARTLTNAIPFRLQIPGENKPEGYYDLQPLNDGTGNEGYFAKTFEKIEWVKSDITADEVGLKLTLKINEDDFKTIKDTDENGIVYYKRATYLNEIGLCIANPVKNDTTDVMKNIELCTKLAFESEPYYNQLKSSTILYYIYAYA